MIGLTVAEKRASSNEVAEQPFWRESECATVQFPGGGRGAQEYCFLFEVKVCKSHISQWKQGCATVQFSCEGQRVQQSHFLVEVRVRNSAVTYWNSACATMTFLSGCRGETLCDLRSMTLVKLSAVQGAIYTKQNPGS